MLSAIDIAYFSPRAIGRGVLAEVMKITFFELINHFLNVLNAILGRNQQCIIGIDHDKVVQSNSRN
ncbi:hypothetical protein D3C87_2184550 [compost metagenome]